jgi:hypothetical protein
MRTFATKPEARPAAATPARSTLFGPIQRKLAVNHRGDACEHEADRVADHVMGQTDPARSNTMPVQTRRSASEGHVDTEVSAVVRDVLQSPGQPIDAATRAFIEPRFGHDFSKIRVHADGQAARSASAVNALAYASGRHLVFGAGQYAPMTAPGRRLLAHELTHTIQQGAGGHAPATAATLQRQVVGDVGSPEMPSMHVYSADGGPAYGLRNAIQALLDKKETSYIAYRDAIAKATPAERQFALERHTLLSDMSGTLDGLSFARCVELLGRRAPTFDELRKNSVVSDAIQAAWEASDIGMNNRVTQAHEEGGWVFMDLIDGSLSIQRAKAEGTDFIRLEPPPDVASSSVLVATFHTHPALGRPAPPSKPDRTQDTRRGIPDLVAGNTGAKANVYQVRLSGPTARTHLASDRKIPGPSGGIAP